MTPGVMDWGRATIRPEDAYLKDVLEVGSLDVNGSLREHVEKLSPMRYIGTDIVDGPGVDFVVPAEKLLARYGADRFGLVLSTEMLEHAEHWREALWNMMAVTAVGGLMVVTTCSPGFPRHDWPNDWWRFDLADFRWMWEGWSIDDLQPHPNPWLPGVFIRARKPLGWNGLVARIRLERLEVTPAPVDEP
jgi:hypothetical protein